MRAIVLPDAVNSQRYHLSELQIATSVDDPRRAAPSVPADCRLVLDVGCGAGQTLIAAHLDSGTLACGIDCDFAALRLGQQLTRRVQFVCARGEQLPLTSSSFDLVMSRVALPYMRIHTALREFARVLKPNGYLWLVLHPVSMTLSELLASLRSRHFKDALYRLFVLVNGLTFHITGRVFVMPSTSARCESFQTEHGMRRALRVTGFREVEIVRGRSFVVKARRGSPA